MEIVGVGAGVVILYVVPFLMAVIEGRRRRREQSWHEVMSGFELTPPATHAETPLSATSDSANDITGASTSATATVPDAMERAPIPAPMFHVLAEPTVARPAAELPVAELPVAEPPVAEVRVAEAPATAPAPENAEGGTETDGDGARGPVFEPFDGNARYSFRLEDLHRVRLADAAGLADTPLLQDAERMLGAQRPTIASTVLASPYPVRSACLAGVEREAAMLRVCYLLFPCLWPASRHEAVAEAVFEIDAATGAVAHRVAVRSVADLDETARRAIRENGGEI
jgi:hypothetical protein